MENFRYALYWVSRGIECKYSDTIAILGIRDDFYIHVGCDLVKHRGHLWPPQTDIAKIIKDGCGCKDPPFAPWMWAYFKEQQ